ncbi:MAG: polysaccharide biosynthesis protein [Clostridiales bacterium]|nr:polysaccharide biosynthesis protein [Clostridiales bacterium]
MKTIQNSNQNTFVKQASVLALAGIFSRVIGFLYKLPLENLITPEGTGIYGQGYTFYNFFLIVSSAGLPVAISRMVSARTVLGEYREAHRVFKIALITASALGLLCALLLGFGAPWLTALTGGESTYYTLVSLAPTVFIVAVMAVFRGYFQGQGNAVPTAASQIIEQIFNAVFSVIMAAWFMQITVGSAMNPYAIGAAGGTTGTGIGAVAGLFVLIWVYLLAKPGIQKRIKADHTKTRPESGKKIAKELLLTALPIIAGTAIFSVSALLDTAIVKGRLMQGAGFAESWADYLFGLLSLRYVSMSTLPAAISTAMATAAIPSIVASIALKDKKAVNSKINAALRITMIISIPAAVGMGVLAEPITKMLFGSADGAVLLQVGSISIIFLALAQIVTGMLQATGRLSIPVIGAALGALVKIPLNYILVGIPEINVLGAVISTIFCYVLASLFDWYMLTKSLKIQLDLMAIIIKPLGCSLMMGLSCYVAYSLLYFVLSNNALATVFAIAVGGIVYFAYMILINGLTDEDILRFPAGGRILSLLKRAPARQKR